MARDIARGIAALVGLLLISLAVLGLVDNPLVGEHGLLVASPLVDVANLVLGAVALAASFARRERAVWNGLAVVGGIALAVAVVLDADPSAGGLLRPPANVLDQLAYAVVGVVAVAVGLAARLTEDDVAADEW